MAREQRRLAAIVAADVVGYSRLMGSDETGTLAALRAVYDATAGRLKAKFEDLGPLALKNIERAVQAYAIRWEASDWPVPACAAGFALVRVCEDDNTGSAMIDQGLALNPDLAIGWAHRGAVGVFLGQAGTAIEQLQEATRLNPLDPETYWSELMMAYAWLARGKFDEALKWANQSLVHRPDYHAALWLLAVVHAHTGRLEETREVIPQIRQLHPDMRLSTLRNYVPARRAQDLALIRDGLRLAGLPE